MALQASGPISFSQIANEFGTPSGKNLGAYRISQSVAALNSFPLDAGIPQSGSIQFSNFYSKRLNIVVYCNGNRVTARSRYNDNSNVYVIGGYKTRPSSSSGSKVWIHTNEFIGSNVAASSAPNREYCSLITGGWDGNTDLRLDIGPGGFVSGAGGDGGTGGSDRCGGGGGGRFGTSAIGVNHQPIIITNRGRIQGGTGGGGGGGAAFGENRRSRRRDVIARAAGGGGGGGMGSPSGAGGGPGSGTSGTRTGGVDRFPSAGGSGGLTNEGAGGVGGIVSGSGASATGGSGGSGGNNGGSGSGSGFNGSCSAGGGGVGSSGFGIIITNNGTGVSISGNGRIGGDAYNTSIS